jgi:hypothetical protein
MTGQEQLRRPSCGDGLSPRAWVTLLAVVAVLLASSKGRGAETSGSGPVRAALSTPEDHALSPFTGYTRAHWLEIAEKLIAGILPYFDAESGMPELKGVPGETGHFKRFSDREQRRAAFDRSIYLVAYYTAATGRDRVPGHDGSITEPYLKEIIRGTDPGTPSYWGQHPDFSDFGTGVAMAMQISPRFFWEPLSGREKENVLAYLKDLAYTSSWDCNHWYFHMAPVPLLDRNGVESNRAYLTDRYERLFAWYRGDGWFFDGENRTFDLYNAWGFQLYNEFLAHTDPVWRDRFGERIHRASQEFFRSYPYLFGRDGGPVAWGRSTSYRFGILAPIGWSVLNGDCPLPPGEARRLASGALRYFWERGALSENGLLEPGFLGPNSVVAESYLNRGGPYWAAHGLSVLLVPADDPFWTAVEQPLPADGAGGRVALPAAQMLVKVSPDDGEVRLFPVGQPASHWGLWQRDVKYAQHAYSSFLGWCATGEGGPDLGAGRTGYSLDGVHWSWRSRPRMMQMDTEHLVSQEEMTLPSSESIAPGNRDDSGEITTHTLVGAHGEVHVFWHDSPTPHYLYLGGYGISVPHGSTLTRQTGDDWLVIHGGVNHSMIRMLEAPAGVLADEVVEPRPGWLHSHSFGGKGAFPHWQSKAPVPANTVVVAYVDGLRDRSPVVPEILVRHERGNLEIVLDGKTHTIHVPY